MPVPDEAHRQLHLKFSGRIIDQLGIQMYQSPVAAVAEIVSNAWDAEADEVKIDLPQTVVGTTSATLVVTDNGLGMTFAECDDRFLNAGYNTRGDDPGAVSEGDKKRPLLGRKGIGKFAGFGIAHIIRIETVSGRTGEKTVFEMDVNTVRGSKGEYVSGGIVFNVEEYSHRMKPERPKRGPRLY